MIVLAIESTCDETGASVVERVGDRIDVLSNVVASSADIHTKYGGVVPEVAAREQILSILPTIAEAIGSVASISNSKFLISNQGQISNDQITKWAQENIDAVAVAVGPGLIGSLIIGVETAKTLALAWNKPLIEVNHMAGHVFANWIVGEGNNKQGTNNKQVPKLPAVALVVSGGHTDLIHIKTMDSWEWIGGTRDDAAGECFDKTARLLGLGYPGGPAIERAAAMADTTPLPPPNLGGGAIRLPRPMIHEDTLEMSFSGLKSSLDTLVRENPDLIKDPETVNLLAREVREAVTELLVNKTMKAVDQTGVESVLLAGGVAASKRLREALDARCKMLDLRLHMPEFKYCTDNAAMIGAAAILRQGFGVASSDEEIIAIRPEPGLETV